MALDQFFPWAFFLLAIGLLPVIVTKLYATRLQSLNVNNRRQLYKALGIPSSEKKTIIGFFHPYWCEHPAPVIFQTRPSDST